MTPLLQGIASSVGPLRLISNEVGERGFGKVAGKVGLFVYPIAEGGAKAVRREVAHATAPEQHQEHHVTELGALARRKHEIMVGRVIRSDMTQDRKCFGRQGRAMLAPTFHPLARHNPKGSGHIHFTPRHAAHLTGARCCQDRESQSKGAQLGPEGQVGVEAGKLGSRHGGVMPPYQPLLAREQHVEVAAQAGGVVARAMAGGPSGINDPLNTPPDAPRSLCLRRPDRPQHVEYVGRAHVLNRLVPDRCGLNLKRLPPLRTVCCVAPRRLVIGHIGDRHLGKGHGLGGGGRWGSSLLVEGIGPHRDLLPSRSSQFARLRQRHGVDGTEPHFVALAAHAVEHDPTFGAAGRDVEVETAAIRVPAGRVERLHLAGRQTVDCVRHPHQPRRYPHRVPYRVSRQACLEFGHSRTGTLICGTTSRCATLHGRKISDPAGNSAGGKGVRQFTLGKALLFGPFPTTFPTGRQKGALSNGEVRA